MFSVEVATSAILTHRSEKSILERYIEKNNVTIVRDNAADISNDISQSILTEDMGKSQLTCSALSLQIDVNKAQSNDDV